jgi:hypothetical protein
VGNAVFRDVLWKKYFLGEVAGRIEAERKRPSSYICTESGFPGHVFGKIFLGEKKLVPRKKLLQALLKPELNKEIFIFG